MAKLSPNGLTEYHLGKEVSLVTPFDTIKGKLTDFYGSMDEDNEAIVVIEINDEPYICSPKDRIDIL